MSALAAIQKSVPAPTKAPVIWVLADDRAGNVAQCVGVAERLGVPFEVKDIRYNIFAKLPNWLLGTSLSGATEETQSTITPPWPDMVIAAGRRTAPIARYIKKQSGGATKLIQFMWPGAGADEFDLILSPAHDHLSPADNLYETVGAAHRLTHAAITESNAEWEPKFAHLPKPWFALLVGGDTHYGRFGERAADLLGRQVSTLVGSTGGSVLLTTSRRTGLEAESALLAALTSPCYVYDHRVGDENPYFAYLGLCDAVIVTGDSMSMISEACFTGKPVYIFDRGQNVAEKHKRFHATLYEKDIAHPIPQSFEPYSYEPLDAASDAARVIRERFLQ